MLTRGIGRLEIVELRPGRFLRHGREGRERKVHGPEARRDLRLGRASSVRAGPGAGAEPRLLPLPARPPGLALCSKQVITLAQSRALPLPAPVLAAPSPPSKVSKALTFQGRDHDSSKAPLGLRGSCYALRLHARARTHTHHFLQTEVKYKCTGPPKHPET